MGLIGFIILSILGLLATILSSVIARLLTDDIKEWLPRIKEWLIERAVRKLPEDQRERYEEEWAADINETPGDLSKIIRAFGLGFAADSISGFVYFGVLMSFVRRTRSTARSAVSVTLEKLWHSACVSLQLFIMIVLSPIFIFVSCKIKLSGCRRGMFITYYIECDSSVDFFEMLRLTHSKENNYRFLDVVNYCEYRREGVYGSDYLTFSKPGKKWVGATQIWGDFEIFPLLSSCVQGRLNLPSLFWTLKSLLSTSFIGGLVKYN